MYFQTTAMGVRYAGSDTAFPSTAFGPGLGPTASDSVVVAGDGRRRAAGMSVRSGSLLRRGG